MRITPFTLWFYGGWRWPITRQWQNIAYLLKQGPSDTPRCWKHGVYHYRSFTDPTVVYCLNCYPREEPASAGASAVEQIGQWIKRRTK